MPRRRGKPRRPRVLRPRKGKAAIPQPPRRRKPRLPAPPPPAAALPAQPGRPAPNTTCDVYHAGSSPPTPDVAGVAFHLQARFQQGGEASEGDSTLRWTHVGYFEATIDLRDNYPDAPNTALHVPASNGTVFDIVFVELVNRGLATAYKRAFLDRREPTWPSDEL